MGSKILMLIAQRNFRDEELKIPKKIFEQNKYSVDIAALSTEKAIGMFGLEVKPTISVEEAIDLMEQYVAVVVVGGSGVTELIGREEVLELLKVAKDEYKIIGAICIGPLVLAHAGLLKNKNATVWCSEENQETVLELEEKGARYKNKSVIIDGDIITANGPEAAKEFAEKIIKRLD